MARPVARDKTTEICPSNRALTSSRAAPSTRATAPDRRCRKARVSGVQPPCASHTSGRYRTPGGAIQLELTSKYVIQYHPPLILIYPESTPTSKHVKIWTFSIIIHYYNMYIYNYIYNMCIHTNLITAPSLFVHSWYGAPARPSEIERSSSATAASHRRSADAPPSDGSGRMMVASFVVSDFHLGPAIASFKTLIC